LKGQAGLACGARRKGKLISGERLSACDVAQLEREAFER
jgi:hypothetical protein